MGSEVDSELGARLGQGGEAADSGQKEAWLTWQVDWRGPGKGGLFPQLGGSGSREGRGGAQAGLEGEQGVNGPRRALECW